VIALLIILMVLVRRLWRGPRHPCPGELIVVKEGDLGGILRRWMPSYR